MAKRVRWTGNAADLPKDTSERHVRYVGMGSGGNTYQPYVKTENNTARTVTVEDTLPDIDRRDRREKFDAGQYAGDAGKLFLNGVAEGLAATGASVENLIGKGLDKLFPGAGFEGSGLFNVLYNGRPDWKWAGENGLVGIKQDREYNQESLQQNADKVNNKVLKKAAEFGGDIAYGLGNAAPMAAEAMATGGASVAANLTKEGLLKTGAEVVEKTGVLNTLSKATRDMLTSKDYWTSFASEVGMDYYDAKDNGATEDEALRYALYSAGLNSVIEIGGGIQKIPERPTFKTWLKSAHEEGMEEVQQGIVSRLLENAVYNKGNPIVSVKDDSAVINPVTAVGEYAGGAVVGGILSGGEQLTQRAINRAARAEQNKQAKKVYGDTAQDLVAESLELNPNNELATRLQNKLNNGEELTGSELRQLVEQNEDNMATSDKASIQSAVEGRLSELGATKNVSKMAEIITQQISGENVADSDRQLVENSKVGRQVSQELNPENIRVGAANEAWTGKIGTARINTTAYNRDMQKTGVTGAKYNAETGKLDAIVTNEAGEVKTVPAAEAEMTPMQEELFDWADELKLEAAGPLMVRAYQPEQNMELYTRSFKLAYEYGKAGMPMDYVEKSEGVNYLHPTQIKLAYEEGQAATQRKVQAREEKMRSGRTVDSAAKKKGSVSLRGAAVGGKTYAPVNRKTVDSRQWASVKAMRAFSRAVGVDVVFYQSQANERGVYEGANGFYKDGKLYLDINAGRDTTSMTETAILKTAAHELTHFIQANSAQYEALKSFVVNKLTQEEGVNFEDLVADKQRREPGLGYDEAVDEVVADACEMMLQDSTAVEQLAKENRSLAEKIRDWLREWVENLKIALEGLQADRTESKAMMQYAQELQGIWDNALMDAARNNRGAARENAPAESRRQASPRKKYWRPDLAEGEWRLLERRMAEEIGSRENFLDEATKWVYANEKGVQVFALYGIGDGTDATPLYAVGGEKAAAYNAAMIEFIERSQKYDGDGRSVDPLSELPWRKEGSRSGNLSQTSRKAGDAERISELHGGSRRSDGRGTAERGSEDQRGVKEKFSMREPVEETRDLLAMHNMTVDNLRGALKLGGLPMPSIAIVKASAGHSKYGPISVVFEKNTIDPQADRRNKVYGGDAYTPTAPQVEYPVRYEAMQRVEKHIADLSAQVAGGIFRNDTALRRLGVDSESSMSAEALADRLSRDDSVQAAYLADAGKTLEPVRQLKEFSRYGNGALQQLVQEVGVQELARINAEMEAGNYDAAKDAENAVRDIIRSAYELKHRRFLDRKPELRQQRIDKYMEDNVSRITVEDFVRDAWEFYQDNGATTDEIDRLATADKLHEAVDPADVKKWLLGQLDGVLGEAGIYNGKERYTPSGNERSFAQTHYAYTLENIVRAMSQTQEERGGQTFGVTAKSMQAVSTPSYSSIAEIKSDSGRLGAVEGDAYDAAVEKVEKQIEQATRKVMRENKPHSDNQFEEMQIIGEVMMEAAKGTKTEAAIRKVFQREGYNVSREAIGVMQSMFRAAAQLPTEYFEAKPQRAIRFDEAAAVVVPDNLPAELKRGLEKQGATIREYKAGDEQSRLEAVNADERVRFSVREVGGETMPVLDIQNDTRDYKVAETYLKTLVDTEHPFATILVDAQPVYIGKDLPGEYSSSEYTKSLRKTVRAVKMQAATNLDEMLLLAENGEWRENVKDKHKQDAKNGWYRYSTRFALPVLDIKKAVDHYTVYSGMLLIRNDADGKSYLYDLLDIKKEKVISSTSFSAQERSEVFEPKPSQEQYMQNSRESQAENIGKNQQRDPRLSDRDVLSLAADMALRQQNKSWTPEDRTQLELFKGRMRQLEYAQATLTALKEERTELLAGRKVAELSKDEQFELAQNRNRTDLAKKNVEKWEESLWKLESQAAIKTLLRKSRITVEKETAFKARQRYREKTEERQRYQVLKKRLERTTNEWKRMLLKPTKDRYAPEELVRSCLEVALMLDESGPREGTKSRYRYETTSEALAYMKKQYDALENSEDQFYRLGYDKELSELVERLRKALDGKAIRDLTYEEAGDVAQVLTSMQGILKEARYQIGSLERISTQELVDGAVRQMLRMPERTKVEAATDAVARKSASVMRNIRRMCQYDDNAPLYKLFRQLEEGVKKKDRFIMEANKMFDRFAGDRMLKSATELKTYRIGDVNVLMTEMEAMQLILSAKRELSDKTRHLEGEGFIVPDLELMRKGKGQDAISKGQKISNVFLRDILHLENGLDDWAKDYMHTASEFFNGLARNAINEATVQTKHRRIAITKDYVPNEVDKRTVVKDIDGVKFDATIEGDGMLKSVVAGAQNPLIIRGLNTIVENHIERVGRIYGLAVPIRNFNKAYNAKSQKGQGMSMKEAITRAWPAADTKLIEQAITDLQTSRERSTSDLSKLMRKAEGKFVEATLLSNISVTIKQAASYSTAGLYLSQKALFPYQTTIAKLFAADNSAFAKKLFAEIDEHTPMHYMRRKGMSMEEAATVAKDNSKVVRWMDKKLPDVANPLKWIQNMDVATTAAIWLATKRQVELDGVKQSDPTYWSRVTELYEKVISETQPMYDSLHRPEVQKITDKVVRGLMMFRTQPLQNAGILYDAAGEMAQAKKSGNQEQIKASTRKFKMAVGSQVASLAVFATMSLLAYAVRNRLGRYRDDEEEVTVASVMKRVLGDMAVNGAQLIAPLGGGVVAGRIEKAITGSSYGGTLSIPTLDAINDWVGQMDRVRQDIVKLSEDEEADIVTDSVDFAMDTAGMLGIPAKNAFGILRGIVGNITDLTGHELSWATDKPDPSMAIVKACFENGHVEKGREVIDQVIQSKMDAGKDEKEARTAVRSSLTAYYKKLYLKAYQRNDNEEMKRIRLIIQGSRMYDDNAADVAAGWVKKWAEEEKKKEQTKKK